MTEDVSLHALGLEADGDSQGLLGQNLESGETHTSEPDEDGKEKASKNKRKRAAAKKAAEAATSASQAQSEASEPLTQKCIGFCGKKKPLTDYNADQRKCKECNLHERAFWRYAETQNQKADMKQLEGSDPNLFKNIQREFIKERQKAAQAEKKLKFNIATYKKTLQSRSGDRREDQSVMMWEGLWYEEAKKAEHGYLTKEEAESKWKGWLADKSVRKDYDGPRGYQRCAVPTQTVLSNFTELANQKEFSESERLSRNATPEAVQSRVRMVTSESVLEGGESIRGVSIDASRARAREVGLDMGEMGAPQLEEIASLAQKRRRVSGRRGDGEQDGVGEDNDDENMSEGEGSQGAESIQKGHGSHGKDKDKKEKWFDAETKCRKAERSWVASIEALEKNTKDLNTECLATLDEFRALPNTQTYSEEMAILDRRRSWLQAVLRGDAAVSTILQEQDQEEKKNSEDSMTTSQDMSALTRVGPCKDYKDLKSIECLRRFGAEYRTCNSNEAIKELNEQGGKQKKVLNTLLAAVKAAKGDLVGARKREEASQKKEAEKQAKAEKAAAKAAAASRGSKDGRSEDAGKSGVARKKTNTQSILLDQNSELWQTDKFKIPVVTDEYGLSTACEKGETPFIVSGVKLPQQASHALKEFGRVFASSALRVTEGRAQSALPAGSADILELTRRILPFDWRTEVCSPPKPASLQPCMKVSSFGVAACSVSSARTEVGMQACVRFVAHGSMMVAVLTPSKFEEKETMAQAQALMGTGNAEQLLEAARSGALRVATVGTGDLFFIPPASVVSQKAHNEDVLGIRCGVLARAFQPRLTELYKICLPTIPETMAGIIVDTIAEIGQDAYKPANEVFSPLESLTGKLDHAESPTSPFHEKEDPAVRASTVKQNAAAAAEENSNIGKKTDEPEVEVAAETPSPKQEGKAAEERKDKDGNGTADAPQTPIPGAPQAVGESKEALQKLEDVKDDAAGEAQKKTEEGAANMPPPAVTEGIPKEIAGGDAEVSGSTPLSGNAGKFVASGVPNNAAKTVEDAKGKKPQKPPAVEPVEPVKRKRKNNDGPEKKDAEETPKAKAKAAAPKRGKK